MGDPSHAPLHDAAAPAGAGGPGLTTTKAPFIEQARANGEVYIRQPYELYSEENHQTWRPLFARMQDRWRRYANEKYLRGLDTLFMDHEHVPRLEDVNRFMQTLTGFRARPVSGYVPSYVFFDCLRRREFPTTVTIRDGKTPRVPARARHLPRHRRPRADAHRPRLRRRAGALRRVRAHRGRRWRRRSPTSTSASAA